MGNRVDDIAMLAENLPQRRPELDPSTLHDPVGTHHLDA